MDINYLSICRYLLNTLYKGPTRVNKYNLLLAEKRFLEMWKILALLNLPKPARATCPCSVPPQMKCLPPS